MVKDDTPKTVVRAVFNETEMQGFTLLAGIIGISKPQDILRFLLAERVGKERSNATKYGSKKRVSRETGDELPPAHTPEEVVDIYIRKQSNPQMVLGWLDEIGFLEDRMATYTITNGQTDGNLGTWYLHWAKGGEQCDLYSLPDELCEAVIKFLKNK